MNTIIHVLWTGGWDSTFRIIELLHETDALIQPHYIIDPERSSNETELRTMRELTKILAERLPCAGERLFTPSVTKLENIPPDPTVADAMEALLENGRIGPQYEWLARYAVRVVENPLELSMEDAEHRSYAADLIHNNLVECKDVSRFKIDEKAGSVTTLFGPFRFPIVLYDKVAMREKAERWGTADILNKTWFCHFPVFGRYACGTCRPCVHVMDNGQTWRMGLPGRVRYQLIEKPRRRVPAPVKDWLRQRAGKHVRRWLRS